MASDTSNSPGTESLPTQLIRLQLIDGDAEGMRSVTIAGRTTVITAAPVSDIGRLMAREEADRVAVYFMTGDAIPDEAGGGGTAFMPGPVAYVGQTGSVRRRFKQHHRINDAEWNVLFMATTTDGVFNAAHAAFVEALLCERVERAGNVKLLTDRTSAPRLDEGDIAFATEFADNVVLLSQTLGADLFRLRRTVVTASVPRPPSSEAAQSVPASPVFEFRYTKRTQIPATMIIDGARFIVQGGSKALNRPMDEMLDYVRGPRQRAVAEGFLQPDADPQFLVFVRDMEFTATSPAGSMVYGSSCAGPKAWFLRGTDISYEQWLSRRASAASESVEDDLRDAT